MYNKQLKVQSSRIQGNGVFSTVRIPANLPILEVTGPVLLDREITTPDYSKYLQVGPNTYIGLSGETSDFINHSCDPNCKMYVVGNRAFLYSLYVIPVGAELTFDYSTTSTDTLTDWKMDCNCGFNKCRKVISGFQYLDPSLQENYKKRNMLPLYIVDPNAMHKR